MSDAQPAAGPPWTPLNVLERRVLGVLVEKQKTNKSADGYPLSLNALVTGCNQKSNRDPVLDLSDDDAEETLGSLLSRNLVARVQGGRVERWKHLLYEQWKVSQTEMAVLAELLLRGPQTEGELRVRASRMNPIDDLDELRTVLKPLVERRLVVYLTPEGRRGTILTHGFHDPRELDRLRSQALNAATAADDEPRRPAAAAPPDAVRGLEQSLAEARGELAALRTTVADLQGQVARLAGQVKHLQASLGVEGGGAAVD